MASVTYKCEKCSCVTEIDNTLISDQTFCTGCGEVLDTPVDAPGRHVTDAAANDPEPLPADNPPQEADTQPDSSGTGRRAVARP